MKRIRHVTYPDHNPTIVVFFDALDPLQILTIFYFKAFQSIMNRELGDKVRESKPRADECLSRNLSVSEPKGM